MHVHLIDLLIVGTIFTSTRTAGEVQCCDEGSDVAGLPGVTHMHFSVGREGRQNGGKVERPKLLISWSS